MPLAIIVHGGAREIAPEKEDDNREGCLNALQAGWRVLKQGGSALDAVETAIRCLENDPTFNAGYGAMLNPDGKVRMDAAFMEGQTLQFGGVGVIEGVRHPISVAREVMTQKENLIVGAYAHEFARECAAELCDPDEMISEEQKQKWEERQKQKQRVPANDTVGCVAMDASGLLACGASTGGTGDHRPGRIGDTPSLAAGIYADSRIGACAMTGEGEAIMRHVSSLQAMLRLQAGNTPEETAQAIVQEVMERFEGEAGCILIDSKGRFGWAHTSKHMSCAYLTEGMSQPEAFISKAEETARQKQGALSGKPGIV